MIILAAIIPLFALSMTCSGQTPLKIGDSAPQFESKDQDGKTWKLSDFKGKQAVLIYFYPKDNTPGCTKEACGLRDNIEELKSNKVQILGVSFDSAESHKKFISKFNLNFPLLVDTDGKLADAFGARKEAGKKSARRVSFLINKEGKIAHITDSPSAEKHLTEMREAAAALEKK